MKVPDLNSKFLLLHGISTDDHFGSIGDFIGFWLCKMCTFPCRFSMTSQMRLRTFDGGSAFSSSADIKDQCRARAGYAVA